MAFDAPGLAHPRAPAPDRHAQPEVSGFVDDFAGSSTDVMMVSYNVSPEELFDLFGKFGPIRQVRQGIANNTKGTAFVVYEDVADAKQACDKLNGFNFQNRYLVVLYHQPDKMGKSKEDLEARRASLAQLKRQHGID
ncbi:hypothetical protein S7711_05294 [Stachybotrys chartarum IBT 7711]|uniref:RRM domain-containing protein n=1 Tax=Stachybotrys chartarum (strain CBS 109288 / IBT 7711) TaxID=1280523 RepID=A0A084ALE3_STACB|nr:hypothetical protein S7711_05294 [Stachybotrys chartarum IBT 7711]